MSITLSIATAACWLWALLAGYEPGDRQGYPHLPIHGIGWELCVGDNNISIGVSLCGVFHAQRNGAGTETICQENVKSIDVVVVG